MVLIWDDPRERCELCKELIEKETFYLDDIRVCERCYEQALEDSDIDD
jgi:formylmethanofuran dehydrogenase subunit E